LKPYLDVLRIGDYRKLWTGLTLSLLGDGATFTAMAWLTVDNAGAAGLGVLGVCYTLPVLLGGAVVGPLLDRFSRRVLLVYDSIARGLVVAGIPLLAALGAFQIWQLYVVAAVYGLLKIIPLAGTPAVLPELVPPDKLQAASGLEATAIGAANIAGPAIGAALIALIGATNVLLLDAATYFLFAWLIARIAAPLGRPEHTGTDPADRRSGWSPVLRLLLRDRFLLVLTLSFAAFNVSAGALLVALPWLVKFEYAKGPAILGLILAAGAAAELVGSLVSGAVRTSDRQMVRIGLLQLFAGASLLLMLPRDLPLVIAGLVLSSILTGPMTVLGGVVRLTRTPNALRGRAMTLMRTMMSGALPLGSAIGGLLLVGGHYTALVVAVATLAAAPGVFTALSFRNASFRLGPSDLSPSDLSPSDLSQFDLGPSDLGQSDLGVESDAKPVSDGDRHAATADA
jgi:MFS family permease